MLNVIKEGCNKMEELIEAMNSFLRQHYPHQVHRV